MTQQFWIPGPLPGMNDTIKAAKGFGGRGFGYSKLKCAWTAIAANRVLAAKLQPMERAHISFTWRERKRNRDPDNIASAKKYVLDGMVTAGVLSGDGWPHVVGFTDAFEHVPGGPSGVLVTMVTA